MNDGTARGDRTPAGSAVPAADDERAEGSGLGDATVTLTPGQLAFLALIAAVILAILSRLLGRRGSGPS